MELRDEQGGADGAAVGVGLSDVRPLRRSVQDHAGRQEDADDRAPGEQAHGGVRPEARGGLGSGEADSRAPAQAGELGNKAQNNDQRRQAQRRGILKLYFNTLYTIHSSKFHINNVYLYINFN